MKIKKLVTALCAAACLALSAPVLSAVPGPAEVIGTVKAADGWQQDDNGVYYLLGEQRLTGLQTIDGSKYYFDPATGYRVSDTVMIDGRVYCFNPLAGENNGKLITGQKGKMVKFGADSEIYYYFLNNSGRVAANKWVKYRGKAFYADAEGKIRLGTIKVKGKLYHITKNGRMTSYGRSSYDRNCYYAAANGVLQTGRQEINGKTYYFSIKNGARLTGMLTLGKSTYFFSNINGAAKTGWVKFDGKCYYFNKNYKLVTGFKTINKKKYYLDPAKSGLRLENAWARINGKYYYFGKYGVMKKGFVTVGDDIYYCGTNGARQYGWKIFGEKKYLFDKKTGVMRTGWVKGNGSRILYLNPVRSSSNYGVAKTGWAKIDGYWYCFKDDGGMRTGWYVENNKQYYFDKKTGKMYTGKHTIDGKVFDFGQNGAINLPTTGPWSIKVKKGTASSPECYVVVYRGGTPVKAFVCSTGADPNNTPTGTHYIMDKLYWHELNGPTWGQYCSHITPSILFHSVPNTRYNDPYSLETWEYNRLGNPASGGCIRLSVKHAKWLFDNVPVGTPVTVSTSVPKPTGITIEKPPKQAANKYYDPTDTFVNPYSVR